MTSWKELLYKQNKYEEAGIPFVQMEKIFGIPFIVKDYEIYSGDTNRRGVRILLEGMDGSTQYIATAAEIIVRVFADNTAKVKELIDMKKPLKFVSRAGNGSNRYISIEE